MTVNDLWLKADEHDRRISAIEAELREVRADLQRVETKLNDHVWSDDLHGEVSS
jgi:hypothetical protein